MWSMPVGNVARNGIALGDLDEARLNAAYLVKAATGGDGHDGYDEAIPDVLDASGGMSMGGGPGDDSDGDSDQPAPPDDGTGYGKGLYLAYLGTPSAGDARILRFGGRHLAIDFTYNGDTVSAAPKCSGVKPKVWTTEETTYAPMHDERDTLVALFASLGEERQAAAQLETYNVIVGPVAGGQSRAVQMGLAVSEPCDEQALVLAIRSPGGWGRRDHRGTVEQSRERTG